VTTSLYMPDVVVELGFGYGYTTPVDDIVWTDVSQYVELAESINVGFGRGDERSTADANSVSLTLDNSDGRFTARRAASPYYPNVKIGVPVRVTATPVDGTVSTRFVGYVDEWPLAWDGTDEYAMAAISATSRLSRLGTTTALRSVLEQEIALDSPLAYYTLGEPEAATVASDSSGNSQPSLTQSDPWLAGTGTPVAFTGASATFAGGSFLATPIHGAPAAYTIGAVVQRTGIPAAHELIIAGLRRDASSTERRIAVYVKGASGVAYVTTGAGGSITSSVYIADGNPHHVAVTFDGSTFRLYVDGALAGTDAYAAGVETLLALQVGGSDTFLVVTLTGTVAGAGAYPSALAAARIASHAGALLDGFAGESTDVRLVRYASYVGVGSGDIVAEPGVAMDAVDTTGTSAVDMMRVCETTEQGVLYDTRDGRLGFTNRSHRYTAATVFTFDFNRQEVESGYQPMLDRSTLLNEVAAANVGGTITGLARDDTSIEDYGVSSTSVEIATTDTADVARLAKWWVARYAEPKPRVTALAINLLGFGAADQDAILALTNGDLIEVTNHPSQAAQTTAAYFVEGVTEDIGAESYMLTFNLSPAEPYTSVLILNDPVRGLPNGSNVLGF
jgi:hypothetical protein